VRRHGFADIDAILGGRVIQGLGGTARLADSPQHPGANGGGACKETGREDCCLFLGRAGKATNSSKRKYSVWMKRLSAPGPAPRGAGVVERTGRAEKSDSSKTQGELPTDPKPKKPKRLGPAGNPLPVDIRPQLSKIMGVDLTLIPGLSALGRSDHTFGNRQ